MPMRSFMPVRLRSSWIPGPSEVAAVMLGRSLVGLDDLPLVEREGKAAVGRSFADEYADQCRYLLKPLCRSGRME